MRVEERTEKVTTTVSKYQRLQDDLKGESLWGKAWRRFFLERDPADPKGTLIIKSFLTEPEAVRVIKHSLEVDSPDSWKPLREALLRQAGLVSWLSDDQREALDRAVS